MKKYLLILLILSPLLLTGCWDRWEVDERGMVLGVGLDKLPSVQGESKQLQVTMQLVEPGSVAGQMKEGGLGGEGEAFWNMTMQHEGSTEEAIRLAALKINREPYFEHLQAVVIGEKLAAEGTMEKYLDSLLRNSEVRKRVKVLVTPATAKEVLEVKPKQEAVTAVYLVGLQENNQMMSTFAPPVDLGKLSRYIHEGRDYLIPRVIPGKDEVTLSGSGVFKGERLVGWLGENESQGACLILGEIKVGAVVARMPQVERDDLYVFEFMDTRSRILPQVKGEELSFKIQIRSEGRLVEHQGPANTLEKDHLRAMEQELAREMERQVLAAIKKTQEYKADVFGFARMLEKRHPALWKELRGDWDQIYPHLDVEVEIQAYIRRVGLTK